MNAFKRRIDVIESIIQKKLFGGIAIVDQTDNGYEYRGEEYASIPEMELILSRKGINTIIIDDVP